MATAGSDLFQRRLHWPYVSMSYYQYQEWLQILETQKMSNFEMNRIKVRGERELWTRALINIPFIVGSWWLGKRVIGPALFRGHAGFRENFSFSVVIYFVGMHWWDSRAIPCEYLEEVLTQDSPNGDYLRQTTKENSPELWSFLERQLLRKGTLREFQFAKRA